MKYVFIAVALISALTFACGKQLTLKNQTRSAGYARGENILLTFDTNPAENSPDSIQVFVLEKKTGYEYLLSAQKRDCDTVCTYSIMWDGRKPDGSWPVGGPYMIYARTTGRLAVSSDTVQVGLGD
jgi:hypothetical protein